MVTPWAPTLMVVASSPPTVWPTTCPAGFSIDWEITHPPGRSPWPMAAD